jgi:hypothetical protein
MFNKFIKNKLFRYLSAGIVFAALVFFGWFLIQHNRLPAAVPHLAQDNSFLQAAKNDFSQNENPEFGIKDLKIGGQPSEPKDISVLLTSPRGDDVSAEANVQNNQIKISNSDQANFRPGLYKLKVTVKEGGKTLTEEKDFSWGVLVINADKSIYLPGDKARLQIGVLNDRGNTICNANLKLEVTGPNGKSATFLTSKGTITSSPTCAGNNVTDQPDYFADYSVGASGDYKIKLTDLDNGREINDFFVVKNSVPLEVQRSGATRINPNKANYKMNFTIKADQDFQGVITEKIPASFQIVDADGGTVASSGPVREISWPANLKAGDILNLHYEYQAPKISPEIYFLGPLTAKQGSAEGEIIFQESRSWQIAADASITSAGSGNWNSIVVNAPWPGGVVPTNLDDVTIRSGDTVSVAIAGGTALSLTVKGTINFSTANTLTITTGGVTISSGGNIAGALAGILTTSGNLTVNGNSSSTSVSLTMTGAVKTISGTGGIPFLTISGTTQNNGNLTISTTLAGASTLTNGANATLNIGAALVTPTLTATANPNLVNYYGGVQTCKPTQYYNLTLQGSGAKTCIPTSPVLGNVVFGGTATWTTGGALTINGNLTITGGTITQGGFALTVSTNLWLNGGSLTTTATAATLFTVSGTTEITIGTLTAQASTGNKTFTGQITVDGGTLTGACATLVFTAGLTKTSGTVTLTGTVTMNTVGADIIANSPVAIANISITALGQLFTGASTIIMSGTLTVNTAAGTALTIDSSLTSFSTVTATITAGTVLNNETNATISGAFTGAGGWTQGVNSVLNLGNVTNTITTLDAHSNVNTVNYYASAVQTCNVTQYDYLNFSGTSAKTCNTTSVLGNVTISGTATWSTGAGLTIAGNVTITGGSMTQGAFALTISGKLWLNGGNFTTTATAATAFTVGATTEITIGTLTAQASTGNKTFTGLITVDGGTLTGACATLVFNSGLTKTSGAVTLTGTVTLSSANATITAGAPVAIANISITALGQLFTGASTITMSGTLTVNSGAGTALTIDSSLTSFSTVTATITSGTVINNETNATISGAFTGAGNWTQGAGSVLNLGNVTNTITTLDAHSNANTVNYYLAGVQTCNVTQYYNLTFSGSGIKTCAITANVLNNVLVSGTATWTTGGILTINGNVTVTGGTMTQGAFALTISGNLWLNGGNFATTLTNLTAFTVGGTTRITLGTLTANTSTGNKTFTGQITVDGGTLTGACATLIFTAGLTKTSGTVTLTGTVTFNTVGADIIANSPVAITNITITALGQLFTGNSTITMGGTLTVNTAVGTALTIDSSLTSFSTVTATITAGTVINNETNTTISGAFTGAGGWTQGLNSVLKLGNVTNTITNLDAHTNANTVNYYASAIQTCNVTQYYNLTFSGTSAKTCAITANVLGDVLVSGTTTWTTGAALTINGNVTVTGGTMTQGAFALTISKKLWLNGGNFTTTATALTAFTESSTTEITLGTLTAQASTGNKTFTGQITVDGGTLTGACATLIFTAGLTKTSGTVTLTGTVTMNTVGADIIANSPVAIANISITALGQLFTGTSTITMSGTLTVNSGAGTALTIDNSLTSFSTVTATITSGTVINNETNATISGAFTGAGGWTQGNGSVLNLGNLTNTITTLDAFTNLNTINYNAAGVQTCKVTNYQTLNFSGSGVKTCALVGGTNSVHDVNINSTANWTLSANTTISGNLSIANGAAFTKNAANNINIIGTTSVAGTLAATNVITGSLTFGGPVTVNSGGTWTFSANLPVKFNNGFINNSANALTAGTGAYTFYANAQNLGGANSFTIANVTNNASSTTGLSITSTSSTVTITTLTQSPNAVLTFSGTTPAITNLSALAAGNTVVYAYTGGNQNIITTPYNNLTINDSGQTATLGGITTVNKALTISSGELNTNASNNYGLTVKGDWSNSGTFTPNSGLVTFNGLSNQTISGPNNFFNLAITGGDRTVYFQSGVPQTILANGSLTLAGTSPSHLLTLAPLTSATPWQLQINNNGVNQSIANTAASYSDASGFAKVNAIGGNNVNNGYNNNWYFNLPADSSGFNQYFSDGTTAIANGDFITQNEVNLYATSTSDNGTDLTLYYQLATTSENFISATTTPASACSSGTDYSSCPSRIWQTPFGTPEADIKNIPDGGYKWQVLSCDSLSCSKSWTAFNGSIPNFIIDTTAPSTPDSLARIASTTTAIKLHFPSAVTENNFYEYKIYYKIGSTTAIHESDSLWGSTSDANLLSRTFNGKSSTTITGLIPATTYSFSLWAYDRAGNKSSSTYVWDRTDRNPTININSASEQINGTGKVSFSFATDDPDGDDQVMAQVRYFSDQFCHAGGASAALDESAISATHGAPIVQNKNQYQIGTSTGWILTSSGVNAISAVWLSQNNLPAGDGTYCLQLTLSDNRGGIATATTSLTIDNAAPSGFGPLALSKKNDNSITLNFGSTAGESNFSQYKIYYKAGSSGVKQTDSLWSSANDSALGSQSYLGHTTTTITGLAAGTTYVFNIFAYDAYGNIASATPEFTTSIKHFPAAASALNQYKSDGISAISNTAIINQSEVKLFSTSTDADSDAITLYYQLATTSGTYISATTTPAGACASGAIWASCSSRIWQTLGSAKQADIKNIPDADYKWQVLACDADGCAKNWQNYSGTTPNFTIDTAAPAQPGNLTLSKKNDGSITLTFGSVSSDPHFKEYKIYYKQGLTGVKQTDTLLSSSSDAALGNINYLTHATTTISNLPAGTTYVFNIYAYDVVGNVASATAEFSTNTKNFPGLASSLNQFKADGVTAIANQKLINQNEVNLFATSTDADSDAITLYYQLATTSGTYISATTTPAGACASGATWAACPSRVWQTLGSTKQADIKIIPDGDYKWQVLACDLNGCARAWTAFNGTMPNFSVDITAPTVPAILAKIASSTTSIKLGLPAAVTEIHFNQYKIYYHLGSTTQVTEGDQLWSSSSDPNLGVQNFNNKSSTTIPNLATGTVYSFSIWAYDQAGNKSSSTYIWDRTDRNPSVAINSAGEQTSGTGKVNFSFAVSDTDQENQEMARVQYFTDQYCRTAGNQATIDQTISATQGTPVVANKNIYQIGTSTGWIQTSAGANTINALWNSATDLPAGDATYCLKITLNDNRGGYVAATTSLIIDNKKPTGFGPLTFSKRNDSSITLRFNGTATESHFVQYKIFYKQGTSGVKQTDSLFGSTTNPGDAALGSQTYLSHTTTTITGLAANTNYVFNIWAYDSYGNLASSSFPFTTATKNFPANATPLNQFKADGITAIANNTFTTQNEVNLYSTSTDSNGDAITLYYQIATSSGAFLSATTTPVGACASGATWTACPSRVWQTPAATKKADSKNIPDGNYKWQVLACDVDGCARAWVSFNATVPNFKMNAVPPSQPNPLTKIASTTASIKLGFPAPVTASTFAQYKIYYHVGSTTQVTESDQLWDSSSDPNLGVQNFNNKSSTTITNLATGTVYSFSIFAYDLAGNKSSSTYIWDRTDRNPSVAINSAAEQNNATGKVNFSFTANDLDHDIQLMAKAEYSADSSCKTGLSKTTLSEIDADTTANNGGDPQVQNKNDYQLGTSTGWILTSNGANTINTIWNSASDLPNGDGTYCLKITLNDNRGGYSVATTSLTIDNAAPSQPGGLTLSKKNDTSITLHFGSAATETNFAQYKIYYKSGSTGVKQIDTLFGSSTTPGDNNLSSRTYNSYATTTVTGLLPGTTYVFNIFAYDGYGHLASATPEFSTATKHYPLSPSTLQQYRSDGTTLIPYQTIINQSEVNLYSTSTDADSDAITLYYQLATTSGTFISATTTPANACSSGTNYSSCPSRVWQTPAAVKKVDLKNIPDDGYKWQVLACDQDGCAHAWTQFSGNLPNFTVFTTAPNKPGNLTLSKKNDTSITLALGATSTDPYFSQYKIYYKIGSSNVNQGDILFGSSTTPGDSILQYANLNHHATTTITGLQPGTTYVFNIYAYDSIGNITSANTEFSTNAKSYPAAASALNQYKSDGLTAIGNGVMINQNEVNLYSTSTDADSDALTLYYQLATSSGNFISATTTPANACSSGTNYSSCPSRVWQTPAATKKADLKNIPSNDYKWQVLACDADGCAHAWTTFGSAPNFTVDVTAPTQPNPLTHIASSTTLIKLGFPTPVTETHFSQYKIYYRLGSTTPVHESDSLFGSSSDSNLGVINFNGKSSTTITGLTPATTYSFSLWAYDLAGNKSSSTLTWQRTDRLPTIAVNSASERIDGSGIIDVSFAINDQDKDFQIAKAEYVAGVGCDFSSPNRVTINESPATYYSQWGSILVQNKNDYQIGTSTGRIRTDFGVNTVHFQWPSKLDLPSGDGTYCLRLTANDSRGGTKAATTTLTIDNKAPANLGNLTLNTKTMNSVTVAFGTSSSESHFSQYRIYYKIGTSGVTQNNTLFGPSSDPALGYLNYNTHTTTTIGGLIANTNYVFNIWAYDSYGNIASASPEFTTKTPTGPTGIINSASEQTDGSGRINISITASDPNNINSRAKLEYYNNAGCTGTPAPITLDQNPSTISATYGTPVIQNKNTYQVGTSSGWILTTPSANTVNFSWLSHADLPTAEGTYCLRLTVNNGYYDQGTPATLTLYIDNKAPTAPGNLTVNKKVGNSAILNFGSPSVETNFAKYHIFYKIGNPPVAITDNENIDANLNFKNYNNKATTTISGLTAGNWYAANIWADDNYGNAASATPVTFKIDQKPDNPNALSQLSNSGAAIANGAVLGQSTVNLRANVIDTDSSSTTFYFQLLNNAGSFTTATSAPSGSCASNTAFGSCGTKIWSVATTTLPSDWYNSGWLYRQKITINHAQVAAALSGFPILISQASDANLAAKARADGNDIIFTAADGRTLLQFNKEKFDSATGELEAWVNSNISNIADTYIYMYYGNAAQSSNLASAQTWNSNYQAVWHLAESGTNARIDSTANGNNAITNNFDGSEKSPAGFIDGGDDFNGSNKFLQAPDSTSLDIAGGITLSGWFNPDAAATDNLQTGGYPRYQFAGLKWAATGGNDCSPDGSFNPAMINPYAGANYGSGTWANGSAWKVYDTAAAAVYYQTNQYTLDLNKIWGNTAVNSEAYIGTYLYSPDNRSVDISRGSDDGSELWVNGKLISQDCNNHFYAADAIVNSVNLKQGWNTVIVRVVNGTGDWAGEWRVSSNATGLQTIANPKILVDKQSYQVAQKGNSLSVSYGTTTVDAAITAGSWQYFTLSGDSSHLELKLNGVSAASTTFSMAPQNNNQPLNIGYGFAGRLDEINIQNTRVNSAWIATAYQNQNNPSSFAGFSAEAGRTGMGAKITVPSIPDAAAGYKWQALVCDEENKCSNWVPFNASVPNFIVSGNGPTAPGALTLQKKTSHSLTLHFGAPTATDFFTQYKIFYKAGASGVSESDSLFGSSSDHDLAYINYNGTATATINNLSPNTQYVFNIFAYDSAGRVSAGAEITATTNAAPTASFVSATEKSDGTGRIDIVITANDANQDNLQAKLEFFANSHCVGTPTAATIDETPYTATSTFGAVKVSNSNTYQIGNSSGWIITSSGANTVSVDWLSTLNIPDGNGIYCLRLTANDGVEDQTKPATTTLIVDNVAPTAPGALTLNNRGGNYLQLNFGAQTQESNFQKYRIFYKQGTLVTEADTELIDANLAYINYNAAATTTASGLLPGKQYSFRIFAYDNFGHKSTSTETTYYTDHLPAAVFNSAAQKTNGTGRVDISFAASDPDGDPLVAKLEYFADAACHGAPQVPTLDNNPGNISATFGHPDINNNLAYQIGSSSKIITSSGQNTINFNWLSGLDLPAGDGIYCLRLTVNDGKNNQAHLATTSLVIDNAMPTAPGDLTVASVNGDYVFLKFGAQSADSHFAEYKIFYKIGTTTVTEADFSVTKSLNYELGAANYSGRATTAVSNLTGENEYSFNIWAYDQYGNKSKAALQVSTTTFSSTGATWRETQDTVDPTNILYLGKGKPVRVRISVANTGDWSANNVYKIQFAAKVSSCAAVVSWNDVPTTSATQDFAMVNSSYFYNGEPTVQRLNNIEGYNYVPGRLISSSSNQSAPVTLGANDYTELEYAFQTTINATAGRTYCFRVLKNNNVLDAYTRYPELTISPAPKSEFVSAAENKDGSEIVHTVLNVSHPAGYPTQVKFEYVASSSCNFSTPLRPTLNTDPVAISATYGHPDISNNQNYQIGSTSGQMIITAYGTNTVAFDWPTLNNFSGINQTYCLRATAYDGYDTQSTPDTTTVVIDQVKPTNPGNLASSSLTSTSVTLAYGSAASDTNFKEYRIYYKEGTSSVTENNSFWGSSSDPNLGYANYHGAATTTITGLKAGKHYVFRLWAYDQYGNKASSSGEVTVYIISIDRSGGPWRWYQDQNDETPNAPMAAENITPNNVTDGQIMKLRMALQETMGIDSSAIKIRLQYSTFSDFSADVNWVGEIGSNSIWTYADGIDHDNDPIQNLLLSTTTVKMTHNESGISTSSEVQPASSWGEWEFTLKNNGAASGTVYYFRAFDNNINKPIYTRPYAGYPSLMASAGNLTLTISGLPAGTATEGITTSATTTDVAVPFGTLQSGSQAIGAQRFTISTNAEWGYGLYVYQTSDLISSNGAKINPVPWTNSSPAAWPAIFNPSDFGYHTGDDNLSGAAPSRFAPDNTYAQFTSGNQEISFSPVPTDNKTFDLIFRAGVGVLQPAGDYSTNIVYILAPTY